MQQYKPLKHRVDLKHLSPFIQEIITVEHFLEGYPSESILLRDLITEGLEARRDSRVKKVILYSVLWGCNFRQAWVSIVAGRQPELDMSQLSDEEFEALLERINKVKFLPELT